MTRDDVEARAELDIDGVQVRNDRILDALDTKRPTAKLTRMRVGMTPSLLSGDPLVMRIEPLVSAS